MSDLTLSRRAVAAGWKWQRGCRSTDGYTIVDASDGIPTLWVRDGLHLTLRGSPQWTANVWAKQLPDFRDAATRGVLFQQVRERWGNPYMYLSPLERPGMVVEWRMVWMVPPGESGGYKSWEGPTETAALVAALEAAPKR